MQSDPNISDFTELFVESGVDDPSFPFVGTVLAPSNEALTTLLDIMGIPDVAQLPDEKKNQFLNMNLLGSCDSKGPAGMTNGLLLANLSSVPSWSCQTYIGDNITVIKSGNMVQVKVFNSTATVMKEAFTYVNVTNESGNFTGYAAVWTTDAVLLPYPFSAYYSPPPPMSGGSTPPVSGAPPPPAFSSPYALLSGTASLSVMKRMVDAAGLAQQLNASLVNNTLLAPSDQAFQSLAEAFNTTVDGLLAEEGVPEGIVRTCIVTQTLSCAGVPELRNGLTTNSCLFVNTAPPTMKLLILFSSANCTSDLGAGVLLLDGVLHPLYPDLMELTNSDPPNTLKQLYGLLVKANITSLPPNTTLLAPTDKAVLSFPGGVANLPVDKLRTLLLYHIIPGKVTGAQLMAMAEGTLLPGDSALTVQRRTTTTGNSVTLPTGCPQSGTKLPLLFDSVSNAVVGVEYADMHIGVQAVVHVVDSVLQPADLWRDSSVTEVMAGRQELSAALAAVQALPEINALLSNGSFKGTVFVPTNNVLMALGEQLAQQNKTLTENVTATLLLNHVVEDRAWSLADLINATQVSGADLPFTLANETLTPVVLPNGTMSVLPSSNLIASIIQSDLLAGSGGAVVHVIGNNVLLSAPLAAQLNISVPQLPPSPPPAVDEGAAAPPPPTSAAKPLAPAPLALLAAALVCAFAAALAPCL